MPLTRRELLCKSAITIGSLPISSTLQSILAAQSIQNLDTSELYGLDALRWYAQQLTLVDSDDLEFKVLEREAKESGSVPYKVNGAYVYMTDEIYLSIGRPDFGHQFIMTYTDSNGASKYIINDVWLKGYLGVNADTINVITGTGNSQENSWWQGYGGYTLFKVRPFGKKGQNTQFDINGKLYYINENETLEGVADYDTTRAPLLTGVYEGKHAELMRRHDKVFRETNAEYRKNLQHIIRELEKEGKIKL